MIWWVVGSAPSGILFAMSLSGNIVLRLNGFSEPDYDVI